MAVGKKQWQKPEVKHIKAGSAEIGTASKQDGGPAQNNHS
jgi:hypothetical protein